MEGQLESIFDNRKNTPPSAHGTPAADHEPLVNNQLLFELQSSLDIEVLLEIFFRHVKQHLPCERMVYHNPLLGLHLNLGKGGMHSAEYTLSVADEQLGQIRFHRRRPFSEGELEKLERLLGALMLPVRNAIRYRQALEAAYVDPLTGIKNRRSYADNLVREMSRAQRENQPLGLMVVDIDHFKRINDEIGHLAGDQVLSAVAQALRNSVRRSDMVFRYAGDEFVLLLPNIEPRCIRLLKARLETAVERLRCRHGEHEIPVSVSIGAAILQPGMDEAAFFEAADLDMLENKGRRHREAASA